jgi:hypothetical protein
MVEQIKAFLATATTAARQINRKRALSDQVRGFAFVTKPPERLEKDFPLRTGLR